MQWRRVDHDQVVGYDTVIDCPVGVCNATIYHSWRKCFLLYFAESENGADPPGLSVSKKPNLMLRMYIKVSGFLRPLLSRHLSLLYDIRSL